MVELPYGDGTRIRRANCDANCDADVHKYGHINAAGDADAN